MAVSNIIKKKLVPLLQELIRNKCVNDGGSNSGQEIRSAHTLEKFFSSYGIKSEILESHPGRANLISRFRGKDPQAPSLMFMGHLDVVPANYELWSCDPFAADVRGGYVWGRGAVDMLSMLAAQAVAFAEICKNKVNLGGDLIFLAVADEEASGRLGARWLVEKHWDKVKTDYLIGELGGFFVNDQKGQGITITSGEKGIAWTRLKTYGTAGHGSMPYKADNAAFKIAKALQKIYRHKCEFNFCKEYLAMVEELAANKREKTQLKNTKTVSKTLQRLYKREPGLAKFIHTAAQMTISPNIIRVGNKTNVIPDCGTIDLDVRILPTQTVEQVIMEIKDILGPIYEDFKVEIVEYFPSTSSPLKTPLYKAMCEIIGSVYPLARFIPFFIGGVTDGRFWRKKGTVVYGFSLYDDEFTLSEYVNMVHGKDERISLRSLELSYNFFYKIPEVFFNKVRSAL